MTGIPVVVLQRVQEETFTFTPNGGGRIITILSGRLREYLLRCCMDRVIPLTFPHEDTEETIIARHGLEGPRMASMTEEEATEPVIVGIWPATPSHPVLSHVLIDGGHRRWFWWTRSVFTPRGWAVPQSVWQHFLFRDEDFIHATHYHDGSMLPQRSGRWPASNQPKKFK